MPTCAGEHPGEHSGWVVLSTGRAVFSSNTVFLLFHSFSFSAACKGILFTCVVFYSIERQGESVKILFVFNSVLFLIFERQRRDMALRES